MVLHYDEPSVDTVLEQGMTFTIEPMITLGADRLRHLGRRLDRRHQGRERTAQFEHTMLVTADGAEILTLA